MSTSAILFAGYVASIVLVLVFLAAHAATIAEPVSESARAMFVLAFIPALGTLLALYCVGSFLLDLIFDTALERRRAAASHPPTERPD